MKSVCPEMRYSIFSVENIPRSMMNVIFFTPADFNISTVFFTVVTSTTLPGYTS